MKQLVGFFALAALAAITGMADEMFPFVISYDSPDNVVNFSHLLEKPAGASGRIRVENGHFVNNKGRVRFNATNLTGPANFPTHEEAEKLAKRLARFGFNCVRLHYMDWDYGNFKEEAQHALTAIEPNTKRNLDPVQLERLDYLIYQLKLQGIYVNINLHVARDLDELDGFKGAHPWANKGLDNFEPRMIELQKEYAKKLLQHINPYTKLPYTTDPCVAMVEINNENAMRRKFSSGFDQLGPAFQEEAKRQWNVWLKNKYQTYEALAEAWKITAKPIGEELVSDGKFDTPITIDGKQWILQKGKSNVSLKTVNGVLQITVTESDNLFPKLLRPVPLQNGETYTLSFRLRKVKGSVGDEIGYAVADGINGWKDCGTHGTLPNVGKEWQSLSVPFCAALAKSNRAQVQITRFKEGVYELDDVSLRIGATNSITLGGKSLKDGTIPLFSSKKISSAQVQKDHIAFIHDTELAYWKGFCDYLHQELGLLAPVSGTQLGYSFSDVQAALDYCDDHAYWQHPSPVSGNWKIGNDSMVNSLGRVNALTERRKTVPTKPYTVSEYNHPYPNFYGAEGQPFLRSYGAAYGWDGVFEYTYNHRNFFEPDHNTYFFSIVARTDVLAHMPACAAIFLRQDVREVADVAANLWTGKETLLTSQSGELIWNKEIPGKGYFTVDTANTKLFTGFPENRTIQLGGVTLQIGKTSLGWTTISLTTHKGQGFEKAGSSLLTATGLSHNNGAKFQHSKNGIFTRGDDWGKGPVMNEGIPAVITLPATPEQIACFALDESGNRKQSIPVTKAADGKAAIEISPKYKTVWYEILHR
ncbi:MAG: beta-galactosidase [Kiritimatiellae bacterium]|nr:beta-galactosidase [Kiritimatiellia bacterium]